MSGTIASFFRNLWWEKSGERPVVPVNENAFPAFLEIDIRGNEVEVPFFMLHYVIDAKRQGYDKVAFNLVNGNDREGRRTIHLKTVSTILTAFDGALHSSMSLAHVVTTKGVHYYGNSGIILDGSYSPLLISTIMVKFEDNRTTLYRPMCRLSYKVFENPTELLEKTIIKWAIPYFADNSIGLSYGAHYSDELVELTISNLDSFIVIPSRPTLAGTSQEAVNQAILEGCDNQ